MGTGALIGAVLRVLEYFDNNNIKVITAGDIGEGYGSLKIYDRLKEVDDDLLVIHYIKPKISKIKEIDFSPKIIADAGGMYAGKAANIGDKFYLFLPDVGELAFLADEKAIHPAYVRGFISEIDDKEVPKLIERAYKLKMPKYMIVKGENDYVVKEGKIIDIIKEPKIEAMECIGGTGDTLTGIVSALISAGFKAEEAMSLGCRINRKLGEVVNAKPNTQILGIINAIPKVLNECIK
ncbi:conserved hypothetical protein [Methanocaldococcus fervens AG86]|uniref:YjeF C-terminal domain-containing protein n=1 Tax=Methanocaldococcus fervens (strain DSM 4213 / JCM 15782 / AG86) TaxID=573064 RepID=C7P626_METFA|nr:conserved hypothetical protein [Methanocaldococcus fervens AG86]